MLRYYIYARKSSESEDRQMLSIESQVRELETLAARRGVSVDRVFTEAKSAKSPGRPVFNQILKLATTGSGAHILCWRLDRLSRNPLDSGRISWALLERKIKSIITPEKEYTDASDEQFIAQIEFGIAQKFIADLRKNVIRGLSAKVEKGWKPGLAPIGYLNEKAAEKGSKRILVDPERFPLVRRLWDLMLSGRYSVAELCELAGGQLGLLTRKTGRRGNQPLSVKNIYDIFSNPFYTGTFTYRGELFQGQHKPMVAQDEFDRVQVLLGRKDRPRSKKHHFPFTGLIHCGECGGMITAEEKQKLVRSTGLVKRYVYYHCTKRKNRDCSQRCIEESALKNQIEHFLREIELPKPYLEWILKHLNEVGLSEKFKEDAAENAYKKQIETLGKQLENLLALKISPENGDGNLLSDAEYRAKKSELLEQKLRIEGQMNGKVGPEENIDLTKRIFEFSACARFSFVNGGLDDQREVLAALGSNRVLTDGMLSIQAIKPLSIIKDLVSEVRRKLDRLEPPGSIEKSEPIRVMPSLIPVLSGRLHDVRTSLTPDLKIVALLKPENPDPLFDHESIIE